MIPLWAILAIISAIALSVKEIIIKNSLNKHLDKSYIIFGEHIILALLSLVFFWEIQFYSIWPMWYYYLAKAIIIVVAMELYFLMLEKYEISKISPLMNISPMFLLLFSAVFLSEAVTWIQFGGILLIISGTYFLEIDVRHHEKKRSQKHYLNWLKKLNWKNIAIVTATLILYSFLAITDKLIFKQGVSVFSNIFYSSIFIALIFAAYYAHKKTLTKSVKIVIRQPAIIVFTLLSFVSGFTILYAIAMPDSMVSLIVPLKRVSTLFTALFGGMLFHEAHLLKKIMAVLVMLCGIVLIVL